MGSLAPLDLGCFWDCKMSCRQPLVTQQRRGSKSAKLYLPERSQHPVFFVDSVKILDGVVWMFQTSTYKKGGFGLTRYQNDHFGTQVGSGQDPSYLESV